MSAAALIGVGDIGREMAVVRSPDGSSSLASAVSRSAPRAASTTFGAVTQRERGDLAAEAGGRLLRQRWFFPWRIMAADCTAVAESARGGHDERRGT